MIESIEAEGVYGRFNFSTAFHPDINILTGRNGAGKTTLLKLLWYIYSSNINSLLREISFDRLVVKADGRTVELKKSTKEVDGIKQYLLEYSVDGNSIGSRSSFHQEDSSDFPLIPQDVFQNSASRFFPTFRRIEGGYGLESFSLEDEFDLSFVRLFNRFVKELSNNRHQFIAGISSRDLNLLLSREKRFVQDKMEQIQISKNKEALEKIRIASNKQEKELALTEVEKDIKDIEQIRFELNRPLDKLWEGLKDILGYPGIRFGRGVILGEELPGIITSSHLSSGEKQMLSFLLFNTFTNNAVFFIDEPEISLHPDWQRKLIPLLQTQNPSNQFFISTHSPFIYSLYSDKEVMVTPDKGDKVQ